MEKQTETRQRRRALYKHGMCRPLIMAVAIIVLLNMLTVDGKFAYKKPIYGKPNQSKERRLNIRRTLKPGNFTDFNHPLDGSDDSYEFNAVNSSTAMPDILKHSSTELAITATDVITYSTMTAITQSVFCTCGIFLASQIKKGNNGQPAGKPVILNELDCSFPRNSIGQKQCQTKCLETIVKHLPNSANILCATLDGDCRKERAYLFIKNGGLQWHNTNLAAGREYCCKNGQPYQCPLV